MLFHYHEDPKHLSEKQNFQICGCPKNRCLRVMMIQEAKIGSVLSFFFFNPKTIAKITM